MIKYFSSDQIQGKKKNVEIIVTTDAQLRTFGVNEHTKIILRFFFVFFYCFFFVFFFAESVTQRIETVNTENQGLF